jgi:hypothetical protein
VKGRKEGKKEGLRSLFGGDKGQRDVFSVGNLERKRGKGERTTRGKMKEEDEAEEEEEEEEEGGEGGEGGDVEREAAP